MVAASWPLWLDSGDFPRVPFVPGWPAIPGPFAWAVPLGLIATLALAAAGWRWRGMIAASLFLLGFAVAGDQNRLQPWAYQYALVALALATTPPATALRLARWYAISLYFYSGLSKLDASFVRELGGTFLDSGLGLLGASPSAWPDSARSAAILMMPAGEIAVAAGLIRRSTRGLALAGLIALHGALLAILGPWNLGHSPNVLIWNGAMILEGWLLFRDGTEGPGPERRPRTWAEVGTGLVFLAALILPLGERFGLCDPWPAHALYASHCERADISFHEDDLAGLPEAIRLRLGPPGLDPWRRLDLNAWSRDGRGVPVYPGGRVGSGIAEALAGRYEAVQPVRLVVLGRADPWSGSRLRDEAIGLRAIRARAGRFRINAHPSPTGRPGRALQARGGVTMFGGSGRARIDPTLRQRGPRG